MENFRIGIPSKGRLEPLATDLLQQAGLYFRRQNRTLFARVKGLPIDITFLRTDDIPVLCAEGAIDMGITGSDLIAEAGCEVTTRLELNVGKCKIVLAVPEASGITDVSDLSGKTIATSFPNITKNFLEAQGVDAHLVDIAGSVEIMIQLGVADAIVDLTETGSTIAANRLRIIAELGSYQTVLLQRDNNRDPELADRVVRRLESVLIARAYSLLEYNIPKERLSEAEKITPGFKSPTINSLEDPDWCSVRAMVLRKNVQEVMDRLESLGAQAILETPISNCRL